MGTDNTLVVAILAGIVSVVAIVYCIGIIRSVRFFRVAINKQSRDVLIGFIETAQSKLKGRVAIGSETVNELIDAASNSVQLFKKSNAWSSIKISQALTLYDRFRADALQHDAEVELLEVTRTYSDLLEKDAYIPFSACDKVASRTDLIKMVREARRLFFEESRTAILKIGSATHDRESHNNNFIPVELSRCSKFFDECASYKLDDQQRVACVTDDDANLIVAGAGSGKTSTILAKVRYLVQKRGVSPKDILLISFTKKSADDIAKKLEAISEGGESLAQTFHKFGLEIVKNYTTERNGIIDEPESFLRKTVSLALSDKSVLPSKVREAAALYFAFYYNPPSQLKPDETFGKFIEENKTMNFKTLKSIAKEKSSLITAKGENVRSLGELLVANFLYLNGIEYAYEKEYPLPQEKWCNFKKYHPDFTLTEYDRLYLEYYGVDENGEPPKSWPNIERTKYLDGMEWKRMLHKEQGSRCLEAFSWWTSKNVLFEELKKLLVTAGIKFNPRDPADVWEKIVAAKPQQVTEFQRLVCSFITLFKSNNFELKKFDDWLAALNPDGISHERERLFLTIVRAVYVFYESKLSELKEIDFEDMINLATKTIESGSAGTLPYKYVIVDEFQDISLGRMRLLQALIKNTRAHLLCVGDDWQSIYRFAGSDINIFTHFKEYFPHSVELKIEHTYRNSQQLIDVMGAFVMMNGSQIKKELVSPIQLQNPIIPIVYSKKLKAHRQALSAALDLIAAQANGKEVGVLLLGRTKYDREDFLSHESFSENGMFEASAHNRYKVKSHPNVRVSFMTVHGSKGLEDDYVILLNARNDTLGFPNRIADDPLLQLVLTLPDSFEFAEERRLFYVALTRTKNRVFVLMPDIDYSPFMGDLIKLGVNDCCIRLEGCDSKSDSAHCPLCKTGILIQKEMFGKGFSSCSNFPYCTYKVAASVNANTKRCPECGGFMLPRVKHNDDSKFYGCSNFPFCQHAEKELNKEG